jgi:hypothetical protein
MQAALQNQQTGVQAATGQGQVGSQGVTSMTNLGQAQQSDPMFAASALGKIVGGINAPTTTKNETQLSPLNQIGSIASALGGSVSGTDKLLKQIGVQGGLAGFLKGAGIGGGLTPAQNPGGAGYNYSQDNDTQNGLMITTSDGKIPDAPYNDGIGKQYNWIFTGDGNIKFPANGNIVDTHNRPILDINPNALNINTDGGTASSIFAAGDEMFTGGGSTTIYGDYEASLDGGFSYNNKFSTNRFDGGGAMTI